MVKIGIYVSTIKVVEKTTGVGIHTSRMIKALLKQKNVSLVLFGSYEVKSNPDYIFNDIQFYSIPYKTRLLELSWKIFKAPNIDSFIPVVDAIYIPGEEQVISKKYKIFYTIHDIYHLKEKKYNIRTMLLRLAYRSYISQHVNKILTVSEFSKVEISKQLKIKLEDIFVLGNALGFNKNKYKKSRLNTNDKKYIVIGGPIHIKKGGDEIIELCCELKKVRSDLDIYITGGLDKKYEKMYEDANLSNTKILNIITPAELAKMVENALCYIQLSNYETFGIMVIEAMYLGTPVIINDAPGLLEISNGNSIICNNKDIRLIISKIKKLENNLDYRNNIISNAIEHALSFNWEVLSKKLIVLIKKSINK